MNLILLLLLLFPYKNKHGFFMGYHTTWENKQVLYRSSYELDYYHLLDKGKDAVNSFTGEYMNQYSWAEITVGYLESINS